jgi:hypothetical protein
VDNMDSDLVSERLADMRCLRGGGSRCLGKVVVVLVVFLWVVSSWCFCCRPPLVLGPYQSSLVLAVFGMFWCFGCFECAGPLS